MTLTLPPPGLDEAAYHRRVEQVFSGCMDLLRELTGNRPEIALRPMQGDFGFMYVAMPGEPIFVSYQNPFVFSAHAREINRAVTQAATEQEFFTHLEMMPYWFIPHELTHAFHHAGSDPRIYDDWWREIVANTIQPYLTERLLGRDEAESHASYTAAQMRAVYDRYVEVLRPRVDAPLLEVFENYIRSRGQGVPPKGEAFEMFRNSVPAYVYFGARANQYACEQSHHLETLIEKLL